MVWFHGGGYDYGSGGWPAYDGRNLADKGDVVVVTVNHRLNGFGYLNLAERFGRDFASSGNWSRRERRTLKWICRGTSESISPVFGLKFTSFPVLSLLEGENEPILAVVETAS